MAPELSELEQLFDEAVALPATARRDWLERRAPAALRAQLHRLIEADDRNRFERREGTARCTRVAPRSIGGYDALQPIAQTPTSTLMLAVHRVTGRRCVLKLLRTEMAGVRARERFLLEASIVARLNHPGIVQVYDAGHVRAVDDASGDEQGRQECEGGFPFIAMEYVEGPSIAGYVREQALAPRQRVALLLEVARAVRHAHDHGVLHRDIKPSHIIVGAGGAPKLIDFGIGSMSTPGALPTFEPLDRWISGTPAYMSPEQASGGSQDARADVYALGLVMYEVLADHPPAGAGLGGLGRIRRRSPARLASVRPDCAGDLDAVVHRAMDPDPQRRYASAAALADDLQRLLEGEPVAARPLGRLSRLARQARRRPIVAGVLATTALALVMAGGMTVSSIAATARAGRSAHAALQQSEAAFALANGLLAAAVPENAGPDNPLLADMERRVKEAMVRSTDQPLALASIACMWGDVLHSVGRRTEAIAYYRTAFDVRVRELGEDSPQTIEVMTTLGAALRFDTLESEGLHEQGGRLLEQAARRSLAALGRDHAATIRSHLQLASYYDGMGEYVRAIAALETIGAGGPISRGLPERQRLELVRAAKSLAEHQYNRTGDGRMAFEQLRAAASQSAGLLSRVEAERLSVQVSAVRTLQIQERIQEARWILEAILPEIEAYYGRQHEAWLFAEQRWCELQEAQGDLDEAEAAYRDLIPRAARVYPNGYSDRRVLAMLVSIARIRLNQGDFTEAEALLREVLPKQLDPAGLSARGRDSAQGFITMCRVLLAQGRPQEALPFALLANGSAWGDVWPYSSHPGRAWVLAWLGRCYEELHQEDLAGLFYDEALCIRASLGLDTERADWPRRAHSTPSVHQAEDHRGIHGLDPMLCDAVFAHLRVLHALGLSEWERAKRLAVRKQIAGTPAGPVERARLAREFVRCLQDTGASPEEVEAARSLGGLTDPLGERADARTPASHR